MITSLKKLDPWVSRRFSGGWEQSVLAAEELVYYIIAKFVPWYLRETKDAYAWFKKYSQKLYENLRYSADEENECNSSESSEFVS